MSARGLIRGLVPIIIVIFARSDLAWPIEFRMGGFIASQYVNEARTKDPAVGNSMKFKHARLHIIGTVDENTDAFLQIENATGKTVLQNAFINLSYLPNTQIRVGWIKLPFGIEAMGHPLMNPTIDISAASKRIYRGANDMGIQVKGKYLRFSYGLALVNGNNGSTVDDNTEKDIAARLAIVPTDGLDVSVSYYRGKHTAAKLDTRRYGLGVNYKRGATWLRGEILGAEDEQAGGDDVRSLGGYVVGAYKVTSRLEGVLRYDAFDPDVEIAGGRRDTITLGVNYYLASDGWNRLSADYEIERDSTDEDVGNRLTVQVQVLF